LGTFETLSHQIALEMALKNVVFHPTAGFRKAHGIGEGVKQIILEPKFDVFFFQVYSDFFC